jgi:hypothetical protein
MRPAPPRRPRSRLRSWGPFSTIVVLALVVAVAVITGSDGSGTPRAAAAAAGGDGAIALSSAVPTVGVTPTSLTLGIAAGDPASAAVVGAQPQDIFSAADFKRAWAAGFVGHEQIAGRRVHLAYGIYQVTDQSDPVRQCKKLTEDDRAFAVLADQFVNGGAGCVAVQHQRPLLADFTDDRSLYTQGRGLTFSVLPSLETTAARFVQTLARSGALKGHRVGVLGSALGGLKDPTQKILIPELRKLGVTPVATYYLSGDLGVIGSQIPVAVDAFRQARVDLVLTAAAGPDISQFANRAQEVRYRPHYALNDMGAASVFGNLYPPAMQDATVETALRENEAKTGVAPSAVERRCEANYEQVGGRPLAPGSTKWDALMRQCGLGLLFVQAAQAAGRDLTTQSFVAAMQRVGSIDLPGVGPVSFGPGKVEGADQLRTATFQSGCPCFVPTSGFAAAKG